MPDPVAISRSRQTVGLAAVPRATVAAVSPLPRKARPRDRRLDVFRGLALAMIFANHVPGTVYETLTSRNFGFSDAAEGFVFMAGASAALAYSGGIAARPVWPVISRIWGRAWLLYLMQILITVWALAIASGVDRFYGDPSMLEQNNLQQLQSDPAGFMLGIALMTHQLGYVNILPLYAILLLASPALIAAAMRWPRATVASSFAVWILAGLYSIDLPNYPTQGGWFFNPFAWQILFVGGIVTGLALKRGERAVAVRWWLFWPAVAYLGLALVWVRWPAFADAGNRVMVWIANQGAPALVRDFDKTYVALPRLLHIASLVYVLTCLPWVGRLAASRWSEPLAVMGRNALPVFVSGTILSFLGQAIKTVHPDGGLGLDTVLIASGLLLQFGLAMARDRYRKAAAARPVLST